MDAARATATGLAAERRARRRRRRRRERGAALGMAVAALVAGLALQRVSASPDSPASSAGRTSATTPTTAAVAAPSTTVAPATTAPAPPEPVPAGLLTFRGDATRTFHGTGPVPRTAPAVAWRFPDGPMCRDSTVGGETRRWCGMGWTGQPAVFERDGRTWVVFGAYDGAIHFVDGDTGERILPDLPTGDIVKGSVTVDPDGFPLVYAGSRDDHYRVIAIDGPEPVELWRLAATDVAPTLWNDDWDGAGLVRDDILYVGGENSRFHVVRLNRGYGADGRVTVAPQLLFDVPGWDDQLLADLGDRNVSIEGSVALHGDTAYFANSGGLVQGWDVGGVAEGRPPTRTFRFWAGDDVDATVVVGDEGHLYVGVEHERGTARSREVGQLLRLDPSRPDDPLVWSVPDLGGTPSGIWATPAVHGDTVYAATHGGRLLAVDRATGALRWERRLPGPTWQSPVVVDGVLLQGDCDGVLHAFDVGRGEGAGEGGPVELWQVPLGGCIEATPAVWGGRIWVGTRGGFLHALR